ncbi:hypothetical protein B0J12DRAFT_582444 [Macrophomina phaseolina]|uniref:Uncharacterized protein n=1 Tax=Macrophomina phaseolina TaxID=35725 RepID=A0ABQ8FXL9_9PEZI|nr:hypothetical protein B0J12DRAFT_582444 [Macrophomina phaseolina]
MHPIFALMIQSLCRRIHPLLEVRTGDAHTKFPRTMLHYYLLTEKQLDSIAAYYSQAARDEYSGSYPRPIDWNNEALAHMDDEERVSTKRRPVGQFIGVLPWARTGFAQAHEIRHRWPTRSYSGI